mgnify:CR=1 FL=1
MKKRKVSRFLYWTPRILSILFILFLAMFSLDIFGNFFVNPLFNKNCVDREKEAVNSEHMKNVNNDVWRKQELLKVAFSFS